MAGNFNSRRQVNPKFTEEINRIRKEFKGFHNEIKRLNSWGIMIADSQSVQDWNRSMMDFSNKYDMFMFNLISDYLSTPRAIPFLRNLLNKVNQDVIDANLLNDMKSVPEESKNKFHMSPKFPSDGSRELDWEMVNDEDEQEETQEDDFVGTPISEEIYIGEDVPKSKSVKLWVKICKDVSGRKYSELRYRADDEWIILC